mmetsp:Transcript_18353/g.29547  ORF Transcript_18353/g.29547 Transcript_18353/m.29547 type:complete len:286 (+) Transcript_18353:299-1156(+)
MFLQRVDAADQRGFTGPGRARNHDPFALINRQVDVTQHVKGAVPLVHLVDGNGHFGRDFLCNLFVHVSHSLSAVIGRKLAFQPLRILRNAVADDKEEKCGKAQKLPVHTVPFRRGKDGTPDHTQNVEHRDHRHQCGVLEQAHSNVDDARDRDLKRLRQDDQPHGLCIVEAKAVCRFILPTWQGGQAPPDHLGDISRREHGDHDHNPQEQVRRGLRWKEVGQHDACHKQQCDQRHAPDELNEHHADPLDQRHIRLPPQCQRNTQWHRQRHTSYAQHHVEHKAPQIP